MKAVFMGTSDFAANCLLRIIESNTVDIVSVFVKPEKSLHRKRNKFPVKEIAQDRKIQVSIPYSFKEQDSILYLENLKPDVIIVIDYGLILPKNVLDIPLKGCFNLHASMLPLLRGAALIQRAILNGMEKTGSTVMFMNEALDAGEIAFQKQVKIEKNDDFISLSKKLSSCGAELMVKLLKDLADEREVNKILQDTDKVTFAPKIRKEEGLIDWEKESSTIEREVRALIKWPGSFTKINLHGKDSLVKIKKAFPSNLNDSNDNTSLPGTIVSIDNNVLKVCAGNNTSLDIEKLQIEGKRVMNAQDIINGFQLKKGDRFF